MRAVWVIPVIVSILLVSGFDYAFAAFTLFDSTFVDSFSVGTEDLAPNDIEFNSDGTKMFVLGEIGDSVYEYSLSPPYDVSTAMFLNAFSVKPQETQPRGLAFSNNGGTMFVVGNADDDINVYTISGSISDAEFGTTVTLEEPITAASGIEFNSDGTKMFILGGNTDAVYEYTLSTAFDPSSKTFIDSFSAKPQTGFAKSFTFSNDGTTMFIVSSGLDIVIRYTLSTGFDVSTASYADSFSIKQQDNAPTGIEFNPTGTKMFVVGNTGDNINEYTLNTAFTPKPALVDSLDNFASSPTGVAFNSDGTKVFFSDSGISQVREFALSGAFDITTASPVFSFSVSAQDALPEGVAFNSDGTKMFVVGLNGEAVYEYTLSSAFDLSSTVTPVGSFSVSAQDTDPKGVAFNPDGTKMFVVGDSADSIHEYTLSTAFDLSSTVTPVGSFSVSAQDTSPTGVAFSADGTAMFVAGKTGNDINEYMLSTPYDVSTKTFVDFYSREFFIDNIQDLAFISGGTKMFVVGTNFGDSEAEEYNIPLNASPSSCSPPTSGDWTITTSCTMSASATAPGNVIVQNNAVLTIEGITLDINFGTFSLTVKSGGGVLIKSGGTIT